MPGFPGYDPLDPTANLRRVRGFSVGFVGLDGTTTRMRVSGLGADVVPDFGNLMAAANAAGALSNMGAYELKEDKVSARRIEDAAASDDAYANPGNVLHCVFENNDLDQISVDVPAPDAALFESDGVTLRPTTDASVGTLISDFISAMETAINSTWTPANSFGFVRGVRRSRRVKLAGAATAKPGTITEPVAPLDDPA